MIRGALTDRLQPMVVVEISNGDGRFQTVEALLDTGFSGHLTLPPQAVADLGLERMSRTPMILADGQEIQASVYGGSAIWFGEARRIYVLAMDGQPLLGMSLLADSKITIRAQAGGEVLIEEDRGA